MEQNIVNRKILAFPALFLSLFLFSCVTAPPEKDTKEAEAHNKLGYSYFNAGKISEANLEFQKAIQLDPHNKEALNQLGYISALYKKYDDAIVYYKRAISVDPNYSDAMNNLGVVYLDLENWDEAIKYFKEALKNPLYRNPEKAYTSMGYAYYRKGEYPLAVSVLKDALMRNPLFSLANFTLGLVYVKLGNDAAAIEEFKKVIGIMSEDMNAHWELAHAYLRTGDRDKSLKHFRIVAEKDHDINRSREALEYIELLK